MPLNTAKKEIALKRRETVAQLRARGLTQREIVEALPRPNKLPNGSLVPGITKPDGTPFSLATINADLKALQEEWREQARLDTDQIMGELLAELRQVKRAAWAEKNHKLVRQVIMDEMQAYGLITRRVSIDVEGELQKLGLKEADVINGLVETLAAGAGEITP